MSDLLVKIEFDINKDTFKIASNADEDCITEIIENVLRDQIGAGHDNSEPNVQDTYTITIKWDLSDDSYSITSDTGNKGLTAGILLQLFQNRTK